MVESSKQGSKKSKKHQNKTYREEWKETEIKTINEGPILEKNGQIFINLNVKPNSKLERVTEIDPSI